MRRESVDAQLLSDTEMHLFEAIATLEFTGRRASRSAITAATQRDQATVDEALDDMTRQGLVAMADEDGERIYVPARRDWSAQPDLAAGHPMK